MLMLYKSTVKKMIEQITFTPADPIMSDWGATLKIINMFRELGFSTPAAFVEVVQEKDPDYLPFKKYQQLQSFWQLRVRNKELNEDLLMVLEKLKVE